MFFFFPHSVHHHFSFFFFFNDTATTEIYTLSLHDALPIFDVPLLRGQVDAPILRKAALGNVHVRHFLEPRNDRALRSEEHTSELQSPDHLVCRLLLEKKKKERRLSTTHQPA